MISFLRLKEAQSKLEQLSQYLKLIQFIPLVVPNVDGLPPSAQTRFDVPFVDHELFAVADFDQTQDQVEPILKATKLDLVFYDFGHWVSALAYQIGINSLFYCVLFATSYA
ncbi:hypothetical protein PTKIN_Ptkin14bG0154500 [Pterospermum kingtungense]